MRNFVSTLAHPQFPLKSFLFLSLYRDHFITDEFSQSKYKATLCSDQTQLFNAYS